MKYCLYKGTIGELVDGDASPYEEHELYKFINQMDNLDEEQLELQTKLSSQTKEYEYTFLEEDSCLRIIRQAALDVIAQNPQGDFFNEVLHRVMDTEVAFLEEAEHDQRFANSQTDLRLHRGETLWGEDARSVDVNRDAFEELLRTTKFIAWDYSDGAKMKGVYIKSFALLWSGRHARYTGVFIQKAIKRSIHENFKYCFVNGKCVVPEEYLAKGEQGIKDWQELKRAGNKNNSLEKRINRRIVADKKLHVESCIDAVVKGMLGKRNSWKIPDLEVTGRNNRQAMKSLSRKIISDISDTKLIQLSDEVIINMVAQYWLDRIDVMKTAVKDWQQGAKEKICS